MATYEVWTIGPDCRDRYVGLVDGETEGEAGARADELYGHSNPSGIHLMEQQQWFRTGRGGWRDACADAGQVLDGHSACTALSEQEAEDSGYVSELRNGAWELLVRIRPSVAAELGYEVAS